MKVIFTFNLITSVNIVKNYPCLSNEGKGYSR